MSKDEAENVMENLRKRLHTQGDQNKKNKSKLGKTSEIATTETDDPQKSKRTNPFHTSITGSAAYEELFMDKNGAASTTTSNFRSVPR